MPALDNLIFIADPAIAPWTVREGDNCPIQFIVKYNGVAVDLTGVTGTCSIRATFDAAADLVVPTVTFPSPLSSGTVRVTLSAAQATTLAGSVPAGTDPLTRVAQVGVYDVELQDGTNQVTILSGSSLVSREVTP